MGGIFEEVPASLTFDDWADEIMLHTPGFDVVRAVQAGRDLIQQQDGDCLDGDGLDGYVPQPVTLGEVAWFLAITGPLTVLLVLLVAVQIVRWVA